MTVRQIFLGKQILFLFFSLFYFSLSAQQFSDFIVIDQFGYRPEAVKTAVIRNPQEGFDKNQSFVPGASYKVVDELSGQAVFEGTPVEFSSGATDAAYGDKAWWFDFSDLKTPGRYYILDEAKNVKSYPFSIATDVYNDVLKHAVRMLFYQRAGCEKPAKYAGEAWADGASHVKALQDKNCRLYSAKNDASTERDLHGGWYDAGDYNKYTSWTANYVESLLLSYLENPEAFSDDYNIPESYNGIADILDEAKWGMDWLLRMQQTDGSVLSLVGLSHASPPSSATGQSLYGPASTMATMSSVKAFALGHKVYKQIGLNEYAESLKTAALKAWKWADENPNVIFHNNNTSNGSSGLGAGDQEVTGDYNRLAIKISAAIYLYEITNDNAYLDFFKANYTKLPLFLWNNYVSQYWMSDQFMFMYALSMHDVPETDKTKIKNALTTGFNKADDFAGKLGKDAYRTFIHDYNWGSNKYKSDYGMTFYLLSEKGLQADKNELYASQAEEYIHYIHGVNPFNMVYLTNMNSYGTSRSLTEIYHTWFDNGSKLWDKVGVSTYGPAPAYLAGGPNSSYSWDVCCDNNGCGSTANNALCRSEEIPVNQPNAKMYKDFNTSWPLNSWALTEPSIAYQTAYIRLLSKYVEPKGISHIPYKQQNKLFYIYPNPNKGIFTLQVTDFLEDMKCSIYDVGGNLLLEQNISSNQKEFNLAFPAGIYFFKGMCNGDSFVQKIVIQ